jgi:hypothetical protein
MSGKVGLYAYIPPMCGVAPSQPIVIMFDKFNGLANLIKCAKFQNDRSRGFRSAGTRKWHVPMHRKTKSF